MPKTNKNKGCCAATGKLPSCCGVESIISVDERGQMILPKEVRDKAGIAPGDKLAVISWEQDGKTCCISLVKTDKLAGMVKGFLGPMMKDIIQGD
jgi:antitoxin PrlF